MNFMNPPTAQESSHSVNIFCEETVRYSFVSHLAAALRREGIFVFVDACSNDHNLAVTDGIHVLVFPFMMKSYHYFMSKVVKVSKIIKSSRNNYAYPEFYCVDPLTQVHGWESDVLEYINCPEYYVMYFKAFTASEIVDDVVREISGKFYRPEPVGIYSRLLELRDMLHKQPWGICRSIGIWGMPGIGKTTLAKAVFNHMCNDYDASCFIENFDEAFHKEGLHRLLDENGKILKKKFDINSSYTMRPSLLRDKLCDTSILVVLDDVRNPLFAESFLERLDCFGPGRLVIMTSRDKTVFPFCQINHIYEVQGLNEHEALQLFSHSVFRRSDLVQKEMELSMKVIDYANGNPLALRIYGKELKKNMSEMEAAFLKLKQYPPKEIQDVLKSVYIALDDNEKNIFWDIACVFRGENVDNVVQVLEGWRYFPRIGIDVLVEKCLVTISKNTLHMNNLILSLLSGETESCTRMCEPSSIRYLLEDYEFEASGEPKARPNCVLVVEDIEIISIDTSNLTFNVRHDAFKNMINLKFLKIYRSCSEYTHGLNFPKGLDFLPSELRLLNWENYPFQSLPQDSDFGHLVELNMPYSQLHKLETKTKLKMLKRIVLCHSERLYECDIPLYAQNIELIDLQGCTRLQSFPDTSQLQHLRVVNLSGCIEIKSFKGAPPNIQELHLQGTNIKEIPISIMSHSLQKVKLDRQKLLNLLENFQDVEYIDLESVTELVKVSSYNQGFGKLVHLNMKDCSHLRSLPDMVNLESLQVLHLSGCSKLEEIKGFPKNIRKLYFGGTAVQEVPQFPKSLEFLNAHGCTYLKSVCLDFEHLPVHYTFSNCFNCSLSVIAEFLEKGLTRIASLARAQKQEFIKAPEVSICIPAGTRQRSSLLLKEGPNVMTNLDPWTRKPLSGFAMSVVVSFQDDYHNTVGLGIRCTCTWKDRFHSSNKKIERIYQCWAPREAPKVEWDHLFIFYDTQMHPSGSEVKFEFDTVSWENELLGANCRVTQCGVQIITAPTNDTIPSEFTRESEATSITDEEHHPPTSSRVVEAKIPSPPLSSSEPRKVSSKLRYKGTMFWKWVKTIRRDKKKKSLTDREQVDLTQPSMIRSENLPR